MTDEERVVEHSSAGPAGLVLRGIAMGAVEVVPGVSGGTVAFVTGIYYDLVTALASFGPNTVVQLFSGRWRELWTTHNLGFLLALGAGMLVGVLAFARLMQWALAAYPPAVWATFFGIIAGATLKLAVRFFARRAIGFVLLGVVASIALVSLKPSAPQTGLVVTFFCGMVAVCAWLLPAVSGSFILLLLGQYQRILTAINELQLDVLAALGLGCVVGVLSFSRLLAWALDRWRANVFNILIGFMAGSLVGLWPWRVDGLNVSPFQYETLTNEPSYFVLAVALLLAGAGGIWWLAED